MSDPIGDRRDGSSAKRRVEVSVLVLALVLAALAPARTFAGLVLAYVAAWGAIELALRTRFAASVRAAPLGTLTAIGALAAWVVVRGAAALPAEEGLLHWPRLVDRARADVPALDPGLLRADVPQTFVLYAPGAHEAILDIAEDRFVATPIGAGALRIDVDPHRTPLVSGPLEVTLTIDGVDHARTLEVIVPPAHPRGLVRSPDGSRACAVSAETRQVFAIDAEGTIATDTAATPVACGFFEEGPPFVALGDGVVYAAGLHLPIANLRLPLVDAAFTGDVFAAVARHRGLSSELVVVMDRAWSAPRRLTLPGLADRVVLVHTGGVPRWAVVALRAPARLVVVDLSTLSIAAERPLQAPATALAIWREQLVMGATDFVETPAPNLGNHFLDEQLVALTLPALRVAGAVRTAGRTAAQDHAGDVDRGAGIRGIFVDGERLLVAFEGTRELSTYERLDATEHHLDLRRVDPGGDEHAPESAVVLGDGTIVIASPASGALLRARGDAIEIEHLAPSGRELLRTEPEALRARMGELAFGEATRSGVSCASCHPGGGSDHVAHNIGGRWLAPTLDARGLFGSAPFLRDGSYPRIRDLMEVADHEYRGYRWPAGDRGATIEGYLLRTTRPFVPPPEDAGLLEQGGEIFERAGCPRCHAPPAFTDRGQHPGVALFPRHAFPANVGSLDTPSLRGLSESPPYLFDGRATTLRDVLTTENAANQHGDTRGLSERDLDALVAFLEAIP